RRRRPARRQRPLGSARPLARGDALSPTHAQDPRHRRDDGPETMTTDDLPSPHAPPTAARPGPRRPRPALRRVATGLVAAVVATAAACAGGGDGDRAADDPGDCLVVDVASSPEKIELLEELASAFNASEEARLDDECVFVRVQRTSSGEAEQLL